ncbi:MAG TPA: helix-turn-helix domain-containing protein [Actinopolymorphaceae bacterium]
MAGGAGGPAGDAGDFAVAPGLAPDLLVSAVGYRSTQRAPRIHRGLPSPALTFVVGLDGPIVTGHTPDQATGPAADRTTVTIAGLQTTPAYVAEEGEQSGIQLAVRPLAARAVFGVPAAELSAFVTDGTDVLGPSAESLRGRLAEAPSWEARFAILERYLRRRADRQEVRPPRPEIAEAWRWIARHRGTGSIPGLARHVMMSQRQLTTLFRAELGLTPKAASRLMRFENARRHIAHALVSGAPLDLSRIAQICGYYDHSHLVRDFQQYVGASPTRWIAEEHRNIQAGEQLRGEDLAA